MSTIIEKKDDRFYGRRKGRAFKPAQKKLLEEIFPQFEILPEQLEKIGPALSFEEIVSILSFDSSIYKSLYIEIGFGGGEHLAERAAQNPDIAFVGCEPFINGVSSLLKHIKDRGLKNIRILPDDCRPLLKKLPDSSVEKVFLLFADPWPKARHKERRFVSQENLTELQRIMQKGGKFHFASDDPTLLEWSVAHLMEHPAFELTYTAPNEEEIRPHDWPETRYEQKAIIQGRKCFYYEFKIVK